MQEMTHNLTLELRRIKHENYSNCVNCNYSFQKGDTTHLGYNKLDEAIYVCDTCKNLLEETAVRNRFSPRPYEVPGENRTLWRYMDFAKYVSLLSTQSIYFSRADQFKDDFEGAKGTAKNKSKWDNYFLSYFEKTLQNPPADVEFKLTEAQIKQQSEKLLEDLESFGKVALKRTYMSCWHENKFESEAMWRLYSSYIDNAVAIRTTYKKLYESLGRDPSIKIGRVKYMNYSNSFAGINDAFWRKRKSFEHENEVRAIITDTSTSKTGIKRKCDLSNLIEGVNVSPDAPIWFKNLVTDVNKKFGLSLTAERSNLNMQPFY